MSNERAFTTLDGLRGIAALAIVTRHAPLFFSSVAVSVPRSNGSVISVGPFIESYLAVDFFFALSGFVLAHAYGERLRDGMTPARFMTVRLIRLYPLYLFALLISLVIAQRQWTYGELGTATLLCNLLFALLFLPSPASADLLFPMNSPTWSLFNELLANAFFGWSAKQLKTSWLSLIVALAAGLLVSSVLLGWFGFGNEELGAMADGYRWDSIGAGVVRVCYSFFAGVLVFRIWRRWQPATGISPFILAVALVAVLAAEVPPQFQTAFDLLATLFVFPSLIFLGATTRPTGSLARCFTWVGVASYAIYVLQVPLYELTVLIGTKFVRLTGATLPGTSWMSSVAFMVFVFGMALASDKYIDRPLRAAASRFSFKHPKAAIRRSEAKE